VVHISGVSFTSVCFKGKPVVLSAALVAVRFHRVTSSLRSRGVDVDQQLHEWSLRTVAVVTITLSSQHTVMGASSTLICRAGDRNCPHNTILQRERPYTIPHHFMDCKSVNIAILFLCAILYFVRRNVHIGNRVRHVGKYTIAPSVGRYTKCVL